MSKTIEPPRFSVVPDEPKVALSAPERALERELERYIATISENQRGFLQGDAGRQMVMRRLAEVTPLFPLLNRIAETTHLQAGRLYVEEGESVMDTVFRNQIESACQMALLEAQNEALSNEIRKLRAQIKMDPLTDLPNRRGYDEEVEKAMELSTRTGLPLYCFMADIDDFRHVNNDHGHLAGDEALKEVSHRLKQQTRVSDFVGRFGGEEFISLVFADQDGARSIAQRVVNSIGHGPFSVETKSGVRRLSLTISVGGSRFNMEDHDPKTAMEERADTNLYRAKNAGKNRAYIDGEQVGGEPLRLVRRGK